MYNVTAIFYLSLWQLFLVACTFSLCKIKRHCSFFVLSVSSGLNYYFCNGVCLLQKGPNRIRLAGTIPTSHRLPSTDQINWGRYWSLAKPKSSCSWPNYCHFRENRRFRFQFMNCFFAPRRAFLVKYFYPRTVIMYALGKKGPVIWSLLVFERQFR